MKKIFFVLLITCFTIILTGFQAYAFRCGNEAVGRWDSSASVLVKCGAPFQKESGNENINGQLRYIEKWFYNCGANDFIYSVKIFNSVVYDIDSVQRGSGTSQCPASR
jgi:hypothetical protein